jgi:hypothetical protein
MCCRDFNIHSRDRVRELLAQSPPAAAQRAAGGGRRRGGGARVLETTQTTFKTAANTEAGGAPEGAGSPQASPKATARMTGGLSQSLPRLGSPVRRGLPGHGSPHATARHGAALPGACEAEDEVLVRSTSPVWRPNGPGLVGWTRTPPRSPSPRRAH